MPTYVKVSAKKETPPAKIFIDYAPNEEIDNFRMKVFVSYTETHPSKKNYNHKFFNKKSFHLYPLDSLERKFKNEYIYFALESIYECSITMRVEFNLDAKNNIEKDKEEETTDLLPGTDSEHYILTPK